MNKIIKLLPIALMALVIISGCKKKEEDPGPDTTKPTVEFSKPSADGSTSYTRGTGMDLDAVFRDDRALKNCTITIRYNDPVPAKAELKGIGTPWTPAEEGTEFIITFNSETEKRVQEAMLFDQDIEASCLTGSYTLKFVILDKSDNKSEKLVDVTID